MIKLISKNKTSLINAFEILVYVSISLYVSMIVLSNSTIFYKFNEIRDIIRIIIRLSIASIVGVGLLCILYYFNNFRIKIILLLLFVLLCAQYYIVKRGTIILLYSYIMLGLTNKSNNILRVIFISFLTTVSIIIILSITKTIPNTIYPVKMHYNSEKYRNALGFYVANPVALYFFYLLLQYIYIRLDKFNVFDSIFILVLYSILFFVNETRFPYILSLIALFLILLYNYKRITFPNNLINIVIKNIYVLCPIALFVLNFLYYIKFPYMSSINKVLSGRLALNLNGINKFGIHLLGNRVAYNLQQDGYNTIDSGYMCLLFEYGAVVFVLLICFLVFYCHISNSNYLLIVLFFIAVHSVFDNSIILILANPFYIFFFDTLKSKFPSIKIYIRE